MVSLIHFQKYYFLTSLKLQQYGTFNFNSVICLLPFKSFSKMVLLISTVLFLVCIVILGSLEYLAYNTVIQQ